MRSRAENESTAHARANTAGEGQLGVFCCECGDRTCTSAIRLTPEEYESVRAYATRFVIARNHENPESEQLVEEHERFAVVETVSRQGARSARRSYARQWQGPRNRPSTTSAPEDRAATGGIALLNERWHRRRGPGSESDRK